MYQEENQRGKRDQTTCLQFGSAPCAPFLEFGKINDQPFYFLYFMSTVQFVSQVLLKGEVFYDVPNELQILREKD